MNVNTDLKEHIRLILNADHWDPFEVLGMHLIEDKGRKAVCIRTFLPEAEESWVMDAETMKTYRMEKIHKAGFFEAIAADKKNVFPYRILTRTYDGMTSEFSDPYSFLPVLTDFDLHLLGEGTHYMNYEKLGAT